MGFKADGWNPSHIPFSMHCDLSWVSRLSEPQLAPAWREDEDKAYLR